MVVGEGGAISIEGFILPMWLGHPVLFEIPGVDVPVVVIFSSFETLAEGKRSLKDYRHDNLKKITNPTEFLASMPRDGSVQIIIDPVLTDKGTTRYKQVKLQPDAVVDTAALYEHDGREPR